MNFDNITIVLGILGAYFAILLVMAVSVETILEPFTSLPWLRKKLDPDDILNDIKAWLPPGSNFEAKAAAIEDLATNIQITEAQVQKNVEDVKDVLDHASSALGADNPIILKQKEIALKFAAMRRKFDIDERQRITILRVVSAALGIILAVMLRVNTFEILGTLFPAGVSSALSHPNAAIGGMILTGLAASAGSSFWHDMLGRVRNLKDTVQQVSK